MRIFKYELGMSYLCCLCHWNIASEANHFCW